MGEGGRLGARPGDGGSEVGRVGVRLKDVAGLSGHDDEKGLSGAAHGRMCVPRGLAEAWALPSG